jgi:hypothetical protein
VLDAGARLFALRSSLEADGSKLKADGKKLT